MSLSRRRRATAVVAAAGLAVAAATAVLLTGGSPAGAAAPGTPGCPAEPSYDSTIPAPQGPPAATSLPDGYVGFAVLGADAKTYFVDTDISSDPLTVAPLACLGGGAVDNPAVTAAGDNLVFVVRSANGRIFQNDITADRPNGTGWRQLPGGIAAGGPALVGSADGTVNLFLRGTNGGLYQATRNPAGVWSGFRNLGGGFVGTPAVTLRPGGGFVVAVTNAAGQVFTRSSTPAGAWGGWTRLAGAAATGPALTGGFADGRLDLFVIGKRGGLFQSAYTAGRFGGFRRVEGSVLPTTRIAAAGAPGRLVVYITESYGPGESATGYTQYLPGGWTEARTGEPYVLAPYTWPDGAPEVPVRGTERTAGGSRAVPSEPLR